MKILVIVFALLSITGCAAPLGSYGHFITKMSDEEASDHYSTEGLCRILGEHHTLMRDPFMSPNKEVAEARKNRILDLIKEKSTFTDDEFRLIANRQIKRGMSELSAYCSWGFPIRYNDSTGSWGKHRQSILTYDRYLYIENGILNSWQIYN